MKDVVIISAVRTPVGNFGGSLKSIPVYDLGAKRAYVGTDVRDYQIDGVILHTVLTCRMTSCRTGLTQQLLREVWKVPSLQIQGDMIDSRLFDLDDFLRKCEAFEETMDYYKDERKKAGMGW